MTQEEMRKTQAGMGRTGMKEVALHAGVAMSSVSRVLSNHPDVSPGMRDRVLAAVADLGYKPDLLAQGLRSGITKTVGFLVADISNPLFAEIAVGAETALNAAGHLMLMANSLGNAEQDVAQLRVLTQRRVDGLIVSLSEERDKRVIEQFEALDRPAVLLDRELEGVSTSAVLSDHRQGMLEAARLLFGFGHRRIGFVGGSTGVRPTRARVDALLEACEAQPRALALLECGAYSAVHGQSATQKLLSGRQPPTALIAGGNQILIGVLRELRDRGLVVPKDISLVTCDEVALSEFLNPALATISRGTREMGAVAVELLLAALAGEPAEQRTLPVDFSPRGSCGPPPERDI